MSALPAKPSQRPASPNFSCGPCTKHPGWSFDKLKGAALGRSHRGSLAKAKLQQAIAETRDLLELPADYLIAIMPGSDTGAVEAAMWALLGQLPVDVFAWESFGKDWVTDCLQQLRPLQVQSYVAAFGQLPDLAQARPDHDVIFTWNGTTSGVIVPDADWIADTRTGLTICDATSSAIAVPLPWPKLDVITYSWQKVLGGEAQHGILILSPRAVARLESYTPPWPLPKLFRLTKDGKLNHGIFEGETINTPSLLCVEDALAAMAWARAAGGAAGLARRTQANFKALSAWVGQSNWVDFLCADPKLRSPTSVCLRLTDPALTALDTDAQNAFVRQLAARLEQEQAAYDVAAYRDAPPGLRIWCGATVEAADLTILTQWLDWAYAVGKAAMNA